VSRELLWKFIVELLGDERYNPSHICWEDQDQGIFRLVQSEKVAQMWGMKKNNKNMTYEKLSRAMR
jgi:ETS factor family protein